MSVGIGTGILLSLPGIGGVVERGLQEQLEKPIDRVDMVNGIPRPDVNLFPVVTETAQGVGETIADGVETIRAGIQGKIDDVKETAAKSAVFALIVALAIAAAIYYATRGK